MENIDFEKIDYNTRFLSRYFFNRKIDFPFDYGDIHPDEVDALKKSIEIIEDGQYSRREFKLYILYVHAHEFWKDLYWLKYYEKGKITTEDSFKKQQSSFENNPDKDDILLKHRFDEVKRFKQQNLKDIETIIELVKKFRLSVNKAMPDLESEFSRLLKEHKDLQVIEANKIQVRDEERRLSIEAKKKQRKNPFDDKLLSDIHHAFNGEIWEKISLADFLNSFNGKAKMIKPIKVVDFCFLIGQIEKRRNENSVLNFANWVEFTFDVKQYKTNKKDKRTTILNKLKPILEKYNTQ
jgi:hypothetical protein